MCYYEKNFIFNTIFVGKFKQSQVMPSPNLCSCRLLTPTKVQTLENPYQSKSWSFQSDQYLLLIEY